MFVRWLDGLRDRQAAARIHRPDRASRPSRRPPTTDYAPFGAAEHLKTDQDIAAYLDAVLAEVEATDDVRYFAHALGVVARSGNMSQLARDAGMSREGLYKALSSDGAPSFATILKITRSLGLRLAFEPA